MRNEHDGHDGANPVSIPVQPSASPATSVISRRMLLRGATAAVPTILTLQSGAALAASSNLLGTVRSAANAVAPDGSVQCLEMAGLGGTPTKLDLGANPLLHVQYVTQRQYYWPKTRGSGGDKDNTASIEDMCANGGVFWYKDGDDWKAAVAPNGNGIQAGFLVSSTALTSFASAIKLKTYF